MSHKAIAGHLMADAVDTAVTMGMHALDSAGKLPRSDVLYLEPRMIQRTGHFSRLAACYQELFTQSKLSMTLLHSDRWKESHEPGWHGALSLSDHAINVGGIQTREQMHAFSEYHRRITRRCLVESQAGLAVLPTARFLNLSGVLAAVSQSPGAKGAVIGVMETFPVPDCMDEALVEAAFTAATDSVRSSGKRFLFLAESEPIRDYLLERGFAPDQVHVHPYPVAGRFLPMAPNRPKTDQLRLGCLGASRAVQNPGLLAGFLLSQENPAQRWTVKLNLQEAARTLARPADEISTALKERGVRLLGGAMSNDAYDKELLDLDIMVFPYGERYQTIGSGIFLECLSAGVIPLLPEHSSMRKAYLEVGGQAPPIESMTAQGLALSINHCAEKLPALRENAQDVRRVWSDHPQGPRAWAERIGHFQTGIFSAG